ncbi:MAG: hypothetical protein AAF388_06340, partial [Bacteroidota bacterium]
VALVAVLLIGTNNTPNNEFETLTDTNSVYNAPVIQIVLSEDINKADFAKEYNLSILRTYPNTQIMDVQSTPELEKNLSTLEADNRTVFVKKTGTN